MTLSEIKAAVDAGRPVCWANEAYRVHKDQLGQYLITYWPNGSKIGLTDRSGQHLNAAEAAFRCWGRRGWKPRTPRRATGPAERSERKEKQAF